MHRTEGSNKVVVGGKNLYSDGPPGTTVTAAALNAIQEEICNTIEGAGLTVETAATETQVQLLAAINALIASSSPNSPVMDFESKNLLIDVASATTVAVTADRLSFLNSDNVPIYDDDLSPTFNIATDLMAGTAAKDSTWYWLWLDSAGVRILAPDLTGNDDGADDNKLIDSGADFVTDRVHVGDIVYNTTDLSKAAVSAVDDLHTLSLTPITAGFVMQNGDGYLIRMLSPTGLGAYKSRIGAAYRNAASTFDDSFYTQIQEEKYYSEAAGDFSVSVDVGGLSIKLWTETIKQINDWTGIGYWTTQHEVSATTTSNANRTFTITGLVFNSTANYNPALAAYGPANWTYAYTIPGTGQIFQGSGAATTTTGLSGRSLLDKKPSFHT